MQWTMKHHKHYSTEHMQKAEKYRLVQELDKKPSPPLRKGVTGKRRFTGLSI